jgi:hypothetical protein
MLAFLRKMSAGHTALKERIHAYRIPLPPAGQKLMGFVYFSIPVIGGYSIMQWAVAQSAVNLGAQGEMLNTSPEADQRRQESQRVLTDILDNKKHGSQNT